MPKVTQQISDRASIGPQHASNSKAKLLTTTPYSLDFHTQQNDLSAIMQVQGFRRVLGGIRIVGRPILEIREGFIEEVAFELDLKGRDRFGYKAAYGIPGGGHSLSKGAGSLLSHFFIGSHGELVSSWGLTLKGLHK